MFDFGDEITINSYRIPWLIWVQFLIMLLLILLLYCLSLVSLDPSDSSSSSSSRLVSCDNTHQDINPVFDSMLITNRSQITQVGRSRIIKGEIPEGTSQRVMRIEDIGVEQVESFPVGPHIYFHPCYYVRLARTAFLKCLGLDSRSENPSSTTQRRKKKDE